MVDLNENWICVGIITTLQCADIIVLNGSQRTQIATSVQYALRNTAMQLRVCCTVTSLFVCQMQGSVLKLRYFKTAWKLKAAIENWHP